jgi:hypothetical protein
MLRRDVAEAAALGRFRVIAIETVDQGMELLTGVASGVPDVTGQYPETTLNRRIATRLAALSRRAAPPPPAGRQGRRKMPTNGAPDE